MKIKGWFTMNIVALIILILIGLAAISIGASCHTRACTLFSVFLVLLVSNISTTIACTSTV